MKLGLKMKKIKQLSEVEMAFGREVAKEFCIPRSYRRAVNICNRHKWCDICRLYNFCLYYIESLERPDFDKLHTTKAILKAQINEKEFKLI